MSKHNCKNCYIEIEKRDWTGLHLLIVAIIMWATGSILIYLADGFPFSFLGGLGAVLGMVQLTLGILLTIVGLISLGDTKTIRKQVICNE